MDKNKIYVALTTFLIVIVIAIIIFFNITYKTREEKWDEEIATLEYVEKKYDDTSFLMSIIYKNDVKDEGIVLEGKVLRGSVNVGDTISLVGVGENKQVKVEKILDNNNKEVKSATTEDRINIIVSSINEKIIKPGQVLAKSDTIGQHNEFIAEIYILTVDEGGIKKSFKKNDFLDFYIRTSTFVGKVEGIKEVNKVTPGSSVTIKVKLNTKVALEEGTTFIIRSNSETMGAGEIVKVIK